MTAQDAPSAPSAPVAIDAAPLVAEGQSVSRREQRRDRARLDRFTMRQRRYSAFYSYFVSMMKVVLPALAVVLASLVLFWPQLNPLDNRFRLKPVQVSVDDLENLRMVSPRILGLDAKNEPYTITAALATQAAGGSEVTELSSPKGDISLSDGSWIALTADQGQYNKQTRVLDLHDNVNVFHDAGYELKTAHAEADLGAGSVVSDDPVEGQGPDSQLRGQGFRIYDKGARIIVTGKSRVVLYPHSPGPVE
jgi:lipopolysaccharide export system protein LptC